MEYQHFLNLFTEVLSKDTPLKAKYLRVNQGTFKTKGLHKARSPNQEFFSKIRFCDFCTFIVP